MSDLSIEKLHHISALLIEIGESSHATQVDKAILSITALQAEVDQEFTKAIQKELSQRHAEITVELRDEKVKVARLQMIAYGAVDEEYVAYYNLSLQGEPTTEKDDE